MAKEKVQNLEIKENERLFHYEILGIVLLIISLLAITKMGLLGQYIMLFVKLLFGDWYFLIFFLLIVYSIRCIVMHNKLKINNIRYLGLFLLICSLILLSHFSMHKYVKEYDVNSLVLTLKLYLNSFRNNSPNSIIGGGMIGAVLFNVSYLLLSEVGVILISLIFVFLGVVFISRLTIKEFILVIVDFFKKIFKFFKKTKNNIKSKIDDYDLSYKPSKVRFKISKVNVNDYYNKELDFANRNAEIIKKVLNSMNIFYNDISFIICRNITVYFINSHYKFSYEAFSRNLSKYLHSFLLKVDDATKELIVEVNNINPVPLRICEISDINKNEIIFGIDDRNNYLKLDNYNTKLIIFGIEKISIAEYLDSILLSLMHYKSNVSYYFINLVNNSFFQTSNQIDEIDHILCLINDRVKLLNENVVSSIEEYNNLMNKKGINKNLKYELIIINGIDKILLDKNMYEKIMYLLEISNQLGYYFIFTCNDGIQDYVQLYNLFDYKVFLDKESKISKEYLKDIDFNMINKKSEGLLIYKSILLRYSLLLLTDYEKLNIKK